MNIFARRISFFYRNREWAEKIFDKILENTDDSCISTAVKRRDSMSIVYMDGTKVSFLLATENCRGFRHHLIYLEPAVSYDFYECVARPKLIGREYGGGQVFVLSNAEALYQEWTDTGFCVEARDYFRLYNIRQREMEMDDIDWVIAHKSLVELLVKHIDERIEKECEIASINDTIGTQIKLSRLEAISKLGEWAAENPEVAKYMRQYIDSHETLEEMEDSIDAALRRAKKYAPAMIHILDDCK